MSQITLTDEQSAVKEKVVHYFTSTLEILEDTKTRKTYVPYKTLGGLAGTGKTTLIKEIIANLQNIWNVTCVVCAFTGKAADVLRRKGVHDAATIHSTVGKPVYENGMLVGFDKKTRNEICSAERWVFIVDEGSMVAKEQFDDLLRVGVPVLFVGDHGQLEPVGDDPRLMSHLDFVLTQIQRQAKENKIIQLAYEVRTDARRAPQPRRQEPDVLVLPDTLLKDSDLVWADQIITVTNKRRHAINWKVRELKGLSGMISVGERIICLKNSAELGVFNGQQFTVLEIKENGDLKVEYLGASGPERRTISPYLEFLGQDIPKDQRLPRDRMVIDYGYCTTCHKSQGSEYDKVLVIESYCTYMDMARWRYTAVTRAAKELRYYTPTFAKKTTVRQ